MDSLLFRAVKDLIADAEHRTDGADLLRYPVRLCSKHHLGHHGVERELRHAPPSLGQLPLRVERPQRVELLKGPHDGLGRGRVHEVEVHKILNPQRLEHQHNVAQVGALDLRDCVLWQLILVRPRRVQPEALAWSRPPCASTSLLRRCFRHLRNDEALHARARVEGLLLDKARIDHKHYTVDRQRRLGDVGSNNNLPSPRGGLFEDLRLLVRGEC
mmetsp:Transcript_16133/g.39288  ORF Transcript_16133/g.39288 Transcript_16133/m.39288 type:complete len:215 (-) Transcript_16133:1352-1996(-)